MSKFDFLKKLGILGSITCALSGCSFNPEANMEPGVYGPPPSEEVYDTNNDVNNSEVIEEDTDISTDFDVTENEIECIYGPPEMFGEPIEDFDPEQNIPNEVYGPPAGEFDE